MDHPFLLGHGTVQCCVSRVKPYYSKYFGRAEYLREKPVLSESIRSQAQPIVDAMNSGELSIEEAELRLDQIWY